MNFRHPAFAPYQALIEQLGLAQALPSLDALNALATALGTTQARKLPLRFFVPDGRLSARDYEGRMLQTGRVPTRPESWHDVLNALVWLRFPGFKRALNAAHGEAIALETDSVRGRRRDALTMLDESGVWIVSHDPSLPELLTQRAWHALFWDNRHTVEAAMQFVVVGHALLEKALAPYPSITGKCLLLQSDTLDPDTAEGLVIAALATLHTASQLVPLPIQGIPGWDPDNAQADYYANQDVFRPPRKPA